MSAESAAQAVPAAPATAPTAPTAPTGSGLLATVVAALYETGWTLDVDWDLETFDVLPRDGQGEPLLGVVMGHARAVAFYRVHPTYVPAADRAAVAEFVTRQNTLLVTSAFELDLGTGSLSLRAGFAVPDVELDLLVLEAILERMIAEIEAVHARTQPELEAALAGASAALAGPAGPIGHAAPAAPAAGTDQPTPEDHA